ncbi:hypothetical protein [Burkholderia ubonensis]|uniref:hypothetical protein n=1 Tax=Burkholderia ubonensis TaxID=101571 RepID=UPI000A665FF9|nr:hypothetical protein [Burkholderia ubonensis]
MTILFVETTERHPKAPIAGPNRGIGVPKKSDAGKTARQARRMRAMRRDIPGARSAKE